MAYVFHSPSHSHVASPALTYGLMALAIVVLVFMAASVVRFLAPGPSEPFHGFTMENVASIQIKR